MAPQGPRNGYYYTQREMMLRRDDRLWQQKKSATCLASLPGLWAFPLGTPIALLAIIAASVMQLVLVSDNTTTGDAIHLQPLALQRSFARLGLICSFWNPLAWPGLWLWFAAIRAAEAFVQKEYEHDRVRREAHADIDLRIRE